jgi:hypothetical protein
VSDGSLTPQPDGKILLAGSNRRFNNLDLDFALARYPGNAIHYVKYPSFTNGKALAVSLLQMKTR